MHMLAISTVNKIYIFDVLALDAVEMMEEMKEILENEDIQKIVHDCRGIEDNFMTKFGLSLETWDLLLIAAQSYPKEKVISLNSCIETVLGMKNNVRNQEVALKRPISSEALGAISEKVAFHIAMYHKLVRKNFQRFMQQTEKQLKRDKVGVRRFLDGFSNRTLEMVMDQQLLMNDEKPVDLSVYA